VKKLVIIGAGGLGREVAQYVQDINEYELLGYIDDDETKQGLIYNNIEVLGDTQELGKLAKIQKIYAFCAIAKPSIKQKIQKELVEIGCETINIIHPTAYLSPYVTLGTNVLIGPMCVITVNVTIGDFVHINPQCGIGHDTVIEDYTTFYWNVSTGGCAHIGAASEFGSKSFIRQGLTVGNGVIAGSGAVIVKDVPSNATVKGVPAK
jgi:sugar O-acyltransferase (sialic acid O-acetyltransferase NeuD family)